jgi:DNA-binding NtrC family response regulator
MNKIRALLIDDDDSFAGDFAALAVDSFCLSFAASGADGLNVVRQQSPDVVLLDLRLGSGMDGLETLRHIKEIDPDLPVIMMTEHASVETAVQAIKLGATHYTFKAPNLKELKAIIDREIENVRWKILARRERVLGGETIIGKSPGIQRVREQIRRLAPTDVAVLILGESGTGKELVAREIHRLSPRAQHPFVDINCGNLTPQLFESQFFGHERGAFTGAVERHRGYLEAAHRGTLFLDEVANLPLESQAKVLRVLDTGKFERLGGKESLTSRARIVAATNANLLEEVARGTFRDDLYYRLRGLTIKLPPLRERVEDIPLLAEHFLRRHSLTTGKEVVALSDDAIAKLCSYDWPGNVRVLDQVIFEAVLWADGTTITADLVHLPEEGGSSDVSMRQLFDLPYEEAQRQAMESFQRAYLEHWLQRCEGNITRTAETIGLHRATLHRMLRSLDESAPAKH